MEPCLSLCARDDVTTRHLRLQHGPAHVRPRLSLLHHHHTGHRHRDHHHQELADQGDAVWVRKSEGSWGELSAVPHSHYRWTTVWVAIDSTGCPVKWSFLVVIFFCDTLYLSNVVIGTIANFGWDTSQTSQASVLEQYHLSDQYYTICIRRSRGYCSICYSPRILGILTSLVDIIVDEQDSLK